jgi:hypothetical protein
MKVATRSWPFCKLTCYGIFFQKDAKKACTLTPPLPLRSEYSNAHYLFLAAGSAAESIRFRSPDYVGSIADRKLFGRPKTTSFEQSRREAAAILADKAEELNRLVIKVTQNYEKADCDFSRLAESQMEIDGVIKKVGVLLSDVELIEAATD